MKNGKFVLSHKVSGDEYVIKGIQGLAGKEVKPEGFEIKSANPGGPVRVVIRGTDHRCQPLALSCFSEHPPENELRSQATMV